jgi:ribose transport system substrate-binding protein
MTKSEYVIGFSNLSDELSFTAVVREGIERALAGTPDLKLILRTNEMDGRRTVQHAREFADIPVDVMMAVNMDERVGTELGMFVRQKRIPLIAIEVPIPMSIYFGIDNERAGRLAAEALARWTQARWDGEIEHVLVLTDQRHLSNIQNRMRAAAAELSEHIGFPPEKAFWMDAKSSREIAAERVADVLERWHDATRIGIFCDNDDTGLGALDAARAVGREEHLAVVGQGATIAFEEFEANPDTRLIATTDFHPQQYGQMLLPLLYKIVQGEPYDRENFIEPELVLAPVMEGI